VIANLLHVSRYSQEFQNGKSKTVLVLVEWSLEVLLSIFLSLALAEYDPSTRW
jgi:hypothetical protein